MALPSTEAEYMALSKVAKEAVWLLPFLCELGEMSRNDAVKIYKDNRGSIAFAKNPTFHIRTKHIDIRYHFERGKVGDIQVVLEYGSSLDIKADSSDASLCASEQTRCTSVCKCRVE